LWRPITDNIGVHPGVRFPIYAGGRTRTDIDQAEVAVARTNVDLATETLAEARDRFGAGVTDNIEVVQAQQLLAAANENYIGSLNAHNEAKVALATALGVAEDGVPQYLNLKP
jgi:outer membrane protein TolC